MSHFESWDPKPDAPAEVRGSFQTIKTSNSDLVIAEHMPRLAEQAHLYNVVRSVYMDNARRDHSPGLHWVLTGFDNQAAGVGLMKENKDPSVGSIVAHELGGLTADAIPTFVAVPNRRQLGGRVNFAGAKHLGAHCDAFDSGEVPTRADKPYELPVGLTLPEDISVSRLQDRNRLLTAIDRIKRDVQTGNSTITDYQQHAFDMLVGKGGQQAFDINQESPNVRERYGNSSMGQGTLLARRLVEAGVTYVLVNYSKNNSWDTHSKNFTRLKDTLLPPMDQAASALLVDLEERCMLDDVLVILMGEMGRTPKINKGAGRDHWPDVFSLLIAGGGLTRGQLLGRSSRLGDTPHTRPMHYREILATMYRLLGVDPNLTINDEQDRPV